MINKSKLNKLIIKKERGEECRLMKILKPK
jgi:hypothetical protein